MIFCTAESPPVAPSRCTASDILLRSCDRWRRRRGCPSTLPLVDVSLASKLVGMLSDCKDALLLSTLFLAHGDVGESGGASSPACAVGSRGHSLCLANGSAGWSWPLSLCRCGDAPSCGAGPFVDRNTAMAGCDDRVEPEDEPGGGGVPARKGRDAGRRRILVKKNCKPPAFGVLKSGLCRNLRSS